MPANLDVKLEAILSKLEKLDAIETSVKGLRDTLRDTAEFAPWKAFKPRQTKS